MVQNESNSKWTERSYFFNEFSIFLTFQCELFTYERWMVHTKRNIFPVHSYRMSYFFFLHMQMYHHRSNSCMANVLIRFSIRIDNFTNWNVIVFVLHFYLDTFNHILMKCVMIFVYSFDAMHQAMSYVISICAYNFFLCVLSFSLSSSTFALTLCKLQWIWFQCPLTSTISDNILSTLHIAQCTLQSSIYR